jgi:hypothetical protein
VLCQLYNSCMWSWRRRPVGEGFPQGFKVQRIGVPEARGIANLPAPEIVAHFRKDLGLARQLLYESYDKRYSPSTFITERGSGFEVGWFSRQRRYQCVKRFSNLADAATDYLLFSLGNRRWTPPETAESR